MKSIYKLTIIAALCATQSMPAYAGDNNILAYWKFNEGKGNTVKEQISKRDDIVEYVFTHGRYIPSRDPDWRTKGIEGDALLFDGYSNFMKVPGLSPKSLESGFTVAAWVAPDAYEWGDGKKLSAIVSQADEDGRKGFTFGVYRHGTWGITLGLGDSKADFLVKSIRLPKDQWSHIAASYDPKLHHVELFLNGKKLATAPVDEGKQLVSADIAMQIGRHTQALNVAGIFKFNMFKGLMDDVIIYGKPLSEAAMNKLVTKTGTPPKLTYKDVRIDPAMYAQDRHRPQFHLGATSHWMNEPHAPIYYNGKYHLFYQHNPFGPFWHQIHWGHWVSDDMVTWKNMPVALAPEAGSLTPDGVWSGSATYGPHGEPLLFFTAGNDSQKPNQRTGLAYPADLTDLNLTNWKYYDKPVTLQKKGIGVFGEFRDPFVFKDPEKNLWYELVASGVPGEGGTALLYTSTDMVNWKYQGNLFEVDHDKYPYLGTVWELPVFLPLAVDAQGRQKYVFLINPHGPGAQVDVFYWIGEFDSKKYKFIPDQEAPTLLDFGGGHLTGPSGFVDPKTGKATLFTIAQGMRTPQFDFDSGWAHGAGLPLELTLGKDNTLRIAPLKAFEKLRQASVVNVTNSTVEQANNVLKNFNGDMYEVELVVDSKQASKFGIELRRSPNGEEKTLMYYNKADQSLNVDRSQTSLDPDVRSFGLQKGKLSLINGKLSLRIFVDRSLIEAYANQRNSITTRVYPLRADATGVRLFSNGPLNIEKMTIWPMSAASGKTKPAWYPDNFDAESYHQSGLVNHDFSSCDLTGWTVLEGNAFSNDGVVSDEKFWDRIFFNPSTRIPGKCHFWGFKSGGDSATGRMKSANFILGGNGQINFLLSGGEDIDNLYIALVRKSDNKILMKATGIDYEEYQRVFWDASNYIGEELYLLVVDKDTGGWGHINLDDIHVPTKNKSH
ncbi:GH32 C-terminal domain-containing protein [Vibrio viridaestus]|uniref:beta-fructofuranosidase n=1 Tax=Vibrio viridaestus TaxID=2487322 RepID=A0A3N9TF76_9VIBR|nr:GH32 C-terminal domain-containing protein [Vibrio viridaestus]RQW62524.1 glycoside hydrolase [Vibrio viridaestus]